MRNSKDPPFHDPEPGRSLPMYPGIDRGDSDHRWALIRKVYAILSTQIVLTVAIAAIVVAYRPIALFFVHNLSLYIFLIILPLIVLCPLYFYSESHPINFVLLFLFTVSLSLAVGVTCAFTSGEVILESLILTAAVVLSLTAFTFWAARQGYDFGFLGPFLFAALIILILFALIQMLFPLGRISMMIYGGLASLIFSAYIIYDTDNLIKRYTYDQYIWASVSLYLDVINLFLALVNFFRGLECDS